MKESRGGDVFFPDKIYPNITRGDGSTGGLASQPPGTLQKFAHIKLESKAVTLKEDD